MTELRQIKALKISDLLPSMIEADLPEFKWVDPATLFIESKYQRNIGEKSVAIIRKIFKDFSWARFKPPVVSIGADGKLCVIDGQHTAIAAASHPKLKKIPVMVVTTATVRDRATAFMGHNRDRVAVTPSQLYYSALAAEDATALVVKEALTSSGCMIVRFVPLVWVEGQTMAAGSLLALGHKFGAFDLTRILKILMDAKRAPIVACELNAVADLLWNKDWAGKFEDEDLSKVIRSKSIDQWQADAEANVRKGMKMAMKRAVAIAWFKKVPKKRGRASSSDED